MGVYWITGGVLATYFILVWFLSTWLHLRGSDVWVLRAGLALIGLIGAGVFLWFHRKRSTNGEASSDGAPVADIDLIVQEAVRRLRSSPLGRGASIGRLPVMFLLGESGSTKTTTLIHSALDPELLAGQVYHDSDVVPTRVSNIWYTREAVFVDPAGDLMTQPPRWKRLVKLVQPGRFSASFGKGQQAPRAAIVCYDCGNFLQAGASESTLSAARKLALRLHEVSQLLGISFPVYVLFTKLDSVSFFSEFVRELTKQETSQVLGATLPVRAAATGVYAEEETRRLAKAFDDLFYALAEERVELLVRATEADKLPGIYEFPRELRKLRTLVVQFLVELARPSHLAVNPFLRGFYFSGVRPIIVDDVVQATSQAQPPEAGFEGGATRIFTADDRRASIAAGPARVTGSRKVPQWVFLTQLFNDIIVKDRVALATSGFSTRVSLLRRIALIGVAAVATVCAIGFTVSYLGNRELLSNVEASQAIQFGTPPSIQAPPLWELQRLEATGQLLDKLDSWGSQPPLRLRWGLYAGEDLYASVCATYNRGLRQLVLGPTFASMSASLAQLTYPPAVTSEAGKEQEQAYEAAYNKLKTYLIATKEGAHAKEDPALASELYNNWPASQYASAEQQGLVRAQLDRFAEGRRRANASDCFASEPDQHAVQNSRSYLNAFSPDQRIYQAMLTDASSKSTPVDFHRQYADEAADDTYIVPAAFTRSGWSAMQDALQHPERYGSGEFWVLGPGVQGAGTVQTYMPELRERYQKAYVDQWLAFLKHARFEGYRGPNDISPKIEKVAGARSALLMVLCLTFENTRVPGKEIAEAFSATGIVPADCRDSKVTGPVNQDYTKSLFALSGCPERMAAAATPDQKESERSQCEKDSISANESVRTLLAANAGSNSVNAAVEALVSKPIVDFAAFVKPPPPPGAGDLCAKLTQLANDFPNGSNAFAELQDVFKPGGMLDKFQPPSANSNPRYMSFYNRSKDVQKALFPDGSSLQMHYKITALADSGVNEFQLMTATRVLSSFNVAQDFVWNGDPQDRIELTILKTLRISKTGPLSIFQFVNDFGEEGQLAARSYNFNVTLKQEFAHQTTNQATMKFSVDAGAATLLFKKGSLMALGCTAKMSQQP